MTAPILADSSSPARAGARTVTRTEMVTKQRRRSIHTPLRTTRPGRKCKRRSIASVAHAADSGVGKSLEILVQEVRHLRVGIEPVLQLRQAVPLVLVAQVLHGNIPL